MSALVSPERNLSQAGYFGPVTSSLDWCEANYQFSYYIAELANSVSSLWHVLFALLLMKNASREKLPDRFTYSLISFIIVGLGSFAFHATLLYETQMSDEIPMIIFASTNLWLSYDARPGFKSVSRRSVGLVVLFNVLFAYSYYLYRNPIYHQTVFGSLMLITVGRMRYLSRWSPHKSSISAEIRSQTSWLYLQGVVAWLTAFLIWNLDNIFCDKITEWKVAVGWPLAFLLEGHSWWHFLTGLGTYYLCVAIQVPLLCINDDHRNFTVARRYGLPYTKRLGKKVD